jgi:hypothetical protein
VAGVLRFFGPGYNNEHDTRTGRGSPRGLPALHRGTRPDPPNRQALLPRGNRALRPGMGRSRHFPARDLPQGRRSGPVRHPHSHRTGRQRPGLVGHRRRHGIHRVGRQPRRRHGPDGAGRAHHSHHQRTGHRRAQRSLHAARHGRRVDRRAGHQRARRRLGRGGPAHLRARRRRRSGDLRAEAVDHQRLARRLHRAGRAHRRTRPAGYLSGPVSHPHARLLGRQEAEEGGQSLLRHRRAVLRRLPHSRRAISWAKRTAASTTSCTTSRASAWLPPS